MSAERKTIVRPLSGRWMIFSISVMLTALYPLVVLAQNPPPNIQYTSKAADLGLRGNVRVNPSTLGLEIEIPLGNYPGRAGLNLPVTVSYSSKAMRINYEGYNVGPVDQNGNSVGNSYTITVAMYAEHSAAGWTSSLGFPVLDYSSNHERYDLHGMPAMNYNGSCGHIDVAGSPTTLPCFYVDRVLVWMPDGASHELRSTDQPYTAGTTLPDNLYSVDGSRLRYQRSTDTLFMPDGSRYVGMQGNAPGQYIDRNGNTLTYNGAWTDTLGRVIANPVSVNGAYTGGTGGGAYTAGDYPYSLPGVGGTTLNYTFKWRNLGDPGVLTTSQPLAYIAQTGCPSQGGASNSPFLFWPKPPDTYICNGNNLFNPVVLNQIVLPTGQAYTFTYNIYGEIDKLVQPTGAYERYQYSQIDSISPMLPPYVQANRGVTSRWVSASGSGADEAQWQYLGGGGSSSMTAPDGSFTERFQHTEQYTECSWGYCPDGARAGKAYEERTWSGYQMLRRKLTEWTMTGSNSGYAPTATRNPRVTKEVEIILDTGTGSALAKTTTYGYDLTYQFDVGVDRTSVSEYDYVLVDQNTAQTASISQIPAGALLRTTQTAYLTSDANYRSRNILSLPTSTTIYNSAGAMVAQTTMSYDEAAYPLLTFGSVTGWTDPQTSYRGNATTTSHWLDTSSSYLQAHAQYDQCGSVPNAWDAKGNQSQIEYSSLYNYAYPTLTRTPVPDPTGQYGSTTALVTTSVFDFNTGLVTSTTDANGVTTTLEYNDALDRPTRTVRASGTSVQNQTSISYDDTNRIITTTSDQSTYNDNVLKSQIVYDGLGRTIESRNYEGGTNYIAAQTQYDAMGRAYKVSNPFRQNETPAWTTSVFEALGRVISVTTPDNAVVTTSYSGNIVTVTDQAGKQRQSVTDGLGRLIQVYEDPAGLNYLTSYGYDALDDLITVNQGSQNRFFMYDSLKRLSRAKNPEQNINANLNFNDPLTGNSQWCMAYQYDSNGNLTQKTDARGVITGFDPYDALNRPTVKRYSDGTPSVTYNYDIAANGRGRVTSVSSSVSTYSYGGYDAMGRATSITETLGSQSYSMSYSYDLAGHVTSMTYPSQRVVNYNYDSAGRLADKDATHPAFGGNLGDGTTTRTYSSIASPNGYDAASRLLQEQFGTTPAVYNKLNYNTRGQLAEIRASTTGGDASFNRGKIVNDYSDQCSGASCNGTDNNGNLKKQTVYIPNNIPNNDQNASPTSWYQQYGYDSLNRLTQVHEYTGNTAFDWQQAYTYDRWGNRLINNNGSATWGDGINNVVATIDSTNNRMLAVNDPNHTYIDYDAAGNQTKDYLTSNGTRTYDAENRMITATDSSNHTSTYSYDGDGHRVKRSVPVAGQPSPVETWQVYGLGGELIAEYAANGSSLAPQKEYGYRNGQLLVTVTAGAGTPPVFTDNPLVAGGTVIKAVHLTEMRDAVNQARARAGLAAATWTDATLTGVSIKAVHITELRTKLDEARAALGLSAATYTDASLSGIRVKAVHISELRARVAETVTSTDVRWIVSDQLGTPRMIFDQSGSLANVSRHDYLPFGEELFAGARTPQLGYGASDNVRQKFTHKERDNETGLDFFEARYYSSTQGRFTSTDEFTGGPYEYYEFQDRASENPTFYADITDPQSLNKYQYCYNNPLLYIDPDGHQGVREWFRRTLNGAASTVSEDNGFGRMDAPQTTTGRVIGHGVSLIQSAAEIAGGVIGAEAGGGEAVVTAPACSTGAGCVVPAAGVGTLVVSAVVATHGTLVGVNTVRNIFSRNNSQGQGSGAKEQNKAEPPKRDRSVEGTQVQQQNIEHAQNVHRRAGRPDRIRSIEKTRQNAKHALKKIKSLQDAENQ